MKLSKRCVAFLLALSLLVVFLSPLAAKAQVTFPARGGTGTSTIPSYGQVLVGNGAGIYAPTATSSLGITADVSVTYPLQTSGGVVSLLFGTTTANSWSLQNTFASLFATNASSTSATSTNLAVTGAFNFLGTTITNVSTWFNGLFDTRLATKTTADLTEGANLYFTSGRVASVIAGTTTTALAEGSNLYFTNARADARINATSTLGTLLSAPNLATVGTISSGVWQGTAIGDSYLTKSGNWTGTFDGQEGSYYLDRANHSGSQLAFTISDFASSVAGIIAGTTTDAVDEGSSNLYFTNARARGAISLTTTGTTGAATYDSGTGVLNVPQYAGTTYTATYPVTLTGTAFGLGFGTTSSNTWAGTQTFTNSPVLGTLTGLVKAASGVLSDAVADTDYQVPLTFGDGLTRTSNDIDCDTASGSVFGCLTSADWTTFNNKLSSALTKGHFLVGNDAGAAQATSTVFINSTGTLGLGTTTPSTLLELANASAPTIRLSDTSTSQGEVEVGGLEFYSSDGSSPGASVRAKITGYTADANGRGGYLTFSTISTNSGSAPLTEHMRITQGGLIGIGTGTPYSKLSVWGAGATSATRAFELVNSASTTLFIVNNAGSVGVGTTSPYAALSVVGQTVASYFTATTTTASTFPYASTTALTVSGTNGLTLGSLSGLLKGTAGAVSIATAGTDYESPLSFTYPLTRSTNTISLAFGTTTANQWSGLNSFSNSGTTTLAGGLYASLLGAPYFNATSTTATSTLAGGLVIDTNTLVADYASGYVGIGTTTPGQLLHVSGASNPAIRVTGTGSSAAYLDIAADGAASVQTRYITSNTARWAVGTDPAASNNFVFSTGSAVTASQRMVITTAGNIGIGTTSPYARLSVVGETVSAFFTATTTSTNTFPNLSSTNATTTGAVNLGSFTSALLQTDGEGDVAEYAGTSCTNQFVRSLSALGAATCATVANTDLANSTISGIALGSNLADLTATNSTLTFSGTYNGGTARSIGLNLGNANTWTALQTFAGNGTTTFAGGIQGGTLISAPYFHATSSTATSTFSGGLRGTAAYFSGLIESVGGVLGTGTWNLSGATVKQKTYPSLTWPAGSATTTTATTTVPIGQAMNPQLYNRASCRATSGTSGYRIGDGTNWTNYIVATSTAGNYAFTSNNSFVLDENKVMEVGPLTNAQITCGFDITVNN